MTILKRLFKRVNDDKKVKKMLLEAYEAGYEQCRLDIVRGGL